MSLSARPKALLFDVFGTCVDWRTSVIQEGQALAAREDLGDLDWSAFADAWRAQYQPQMESVRNDSRPWVNLDILHRESLDHLLESSGIGYLPELTRAEFNRVWHRLMPWPDTSPALHRLKRDFIIAPCSNGHIALQVNLAKHADLPWDAILGAEIAYAYKPQPEVYLRSADALGLHPSEVMMVAAHNGDLVAVTACGLQTAFISRPFEHGPSQTTDLHPEAPFDVIAGDLLDLANQLGV